MITTANALDSLTPKASWGIRHLDSGDVIEWHDTTQTQPTDSEITAEVTRLQAEYDTQQYARDRASAYPSLTDQADMAYWDRKNGTTTLDDAITAVKSAYPKT